MDKDCWRGNTPPPSCTNRQEPHGIRRFPAQWRHPVRVGLPSDQSADKQYRGHDEPQYRVVTARQRPAQSPNAAGNCQHHQHGNKKRAEPGKGETLRAPGEHAQRPRAAPPRQQDAKRFVWSKAADLTSRGAVSRHQPLSAPDMRSTTTAMSGPVRNGQRKRSRMKSAISCSVARPKGCSHCR